MTIFRSVPGVLLVVGLCWSNLGRLDGATPASLGENSEWEIGSHGAQRGQFDELRDFTFDALGRLVTLEGVRWEPGTKQWRGNGRIQAFDPATGKVLLSFSVRDESLGPNDDPQRLAIDHGGRIYVTQPRAGVVHQFDRDGKRLRSIALPRARAICRWTLDGQERIAVVASNREVVPGKGWAWLAGEQIDSIDPATGTLLAPIPLPRKLEDVEDLVADSAGNLYLLAAVHQIYKVRPKGQLLKTVGGGTSTRNADGSEPLHSLAVDSGGNVYAMTWGNPGLVTRYDPQFTTVTQREGQFKWADPWSVHSSYTILGIDPQDRLWAASTHAHDPKGVHFARYHATPCVLRVKPGFFDPGASGVTQRSALLLGFAPALTTPLPYAISYDPHQPVPVDFQVSPATRQIREIRVDWRVQDLRGAVVAKGGFDLPLVDREPVQARFQWIPPQFGWFTVTAEMSHQGRRLRAIGKHFGITPRFPGMVALAEGESKGGWGDAPRQMFTGLSNIRLHCGHAKDSLDNLEKQVDLARRYGATFLVQFSDKADCTADIVRAAVSRLKGKVPVWELMNEPNFSMSPEDYVKLLKELAPLIKSIDPAAKVMGPDVCGINLQWHERFYRAGGGPLVDILSVHDYEGHESIDPVHWRWKYAALRELMARHGDRDKPIWQTERAITGVRGNNFLGGAQAVRCTLHRDLLQTLGIAPEHNNHYYLNEMGYSPVPTYVWSSSGPHPAALALRTRYAMTSGRRYAGTVDFGPTGNRLYLGLRYGRRDGSDESDAVLVLRNLGMPDGPMNVTVRGGAALDVVDSFGNRQSIPVPNGRATLTVGQMPIYVRLAADQAVDGTKIDFGRNLAPQAQVRYSGQAENDLALLNNGRLETIHAEHPDGGTDGKKIWQGKLSVAGDGTIQPENLELRWERPQTVRKLILWGLRADNQFCTLLDYDLQVHDGQSWVTLREVRSPLVPTEAVETSLSTANTWHMDDNVFVHEFAPRTVTGLRIVVRRTTRGFVPDAAGRAWGNTLPPRLMLREIEVYE